MRSLSDDKEANNYLECLPPPVHFMSFFVEMPSPTKVSRDAILFTSHQISYLQSCRALSLVHFEKLAISSNITSGRFWGRLHPPSTPCVVGWGGGETY